MTALAARKGKGGGDAGTARIDLNLVQAAYAGNLDEVRKAVSQGADIDAVHEQTGLTAVHIAVGTSKLALTRFLIEEGGARLGPAGGRLSLRRNAGWKRLRETLSEPSNNNKLATGGGVCGLTEPGSYGLQ
jgi:ankyrin repeat protein